MGHQPCVLMGVTDNDNEAIPDDDENEATRPKIQEHPLSPCLAAN